MTLVWLAFALAVLVFGAVYLVWDASFQFRRQMRAITLAAERARRAAEDEAWARFCTDARLREQALADAAAAPGAIDLLAALMQLERLEVVA